MSTRIYYTKPSITELEISYATDAARHGWGDKCYEYISRFEEAFRRHLGVDYAIATSSCTGAIHMGLSALGVGYGDEIILGDMNWIATAAPICHLGAKPVFVDIFTDTLCLNPESVEAAITPRTKAIIAVHLYGNVCDMNALQMLSKKYGVPLIEDAAEAIGSEFNGSKVGSMGLFGCFSFHGTKTLTTGEGGMFVSNSKSLYSRVLALSNHGRSADQPKQFWSDYIGFKYKMSNLQAAIGCAQIERVTQLLNRKRDIFTMYKNTLAELPISMNPEPKGTKNGYWLPTVVVSEDVPFNREELLDNFIADNIDARVAFWPLSSLPMFQENRENQVCYRLSERAFNLPSYHDMTDDEIFRVCKIVSQSIQS